MSPELYLAFIAASALLMLTPGPTVALIVANSVDHGARAGLSTVAGSCAAMILHLAFVCAGLSVLLASFSAAFFWLKWLGAAYLFWLGLRALLASAPSAAAAARPAKSARRAFVEAFFVALSNPKALAFYAAFFPLFVAPDRPAGPRLLVLSATFLAVAAALDSGWALGASRARPFFARAGRWGTRIAGGVLIAAAALAGLRRA
ncbi:LysE family translocator [Amphiplicatus metriothermophilus]|uniref:Threonine/homoserine/homoserine lactone efflux protein n=1 Tax=Amphiplicatus metriothermophilus TaxID=1519374 RepID=A0A239PJ78_9PROT|nr:LysE family transporter [Amphiplicatus metriothermophilus]MBB5517815.1 threonine/homoserine/homoserine lactone efflux protein [Amphiplicatus metriothermophilus]SNT67851.1 Threonine/homoserine/homoserine lactone efflux protein [Amphiplicatus metriothermophilus]